jgi:hypothetical protein
MSPIAGDRLYQAGYAEQTSLPGALGELPSPPHVMPSSSMRTGAIARAIR